MKKAKELKDRLTEATKEAPEDAAEAGLIPHKNKEMRPALAVIISQAHDAPPGESGEEGGPQGMEGIHPEQLHAHAMKGDMPPHEAHLEAAQDHSRSAKQNVRSGKKKLSS